MEAGKEGWIGWRKGGLEERSAREMPRLHMPSVTKVYASKRGLGSERVREEVELLAERFRSETSPLFLCRLFYILYPILYIPYFTIFRHAGALTPTQTRLTFTKPFKEKERERGRETRQKQPEREEDQKRVL